jgi:serine/threonine-protein kinase
MPQLLAALQAELGAHYSLQRELGGGGMSRVFLAEETRFRRPVVLKLLAPEMARGVNAERFEREIALAAALQEPHIVPLITAGTTSDGVPWYSMPFVRGESLRARLSGAAIPVGEALSLLRNVAQALAYAHREGVVHRDIKPENILLHEGTAVVTDFGIARALSDARIGNVSGTLTMLGTALGTPPYMAPEQGAGDPATDHRADLYAWGIVAYEVLAGMHPFAGKTSPHAWLVAHLTESPTPLIERAPATPAHVAALVMSCLAKDPDARPRSADVLLDVLATPVISGAVTVVPIRTMQSIAVLPFESLSPDPNDAFLADGICDEVITDLARLKGVRVISRNSSFQFRGSTKDAQTIGRELGAGYLLNGSVRRAGAALRVTARLIEAPTEQQVWAERYSGSAEDVFEIQERIARDIVAALSVTLSPEEDRRLRHRSIESLEAYECYLKARQGINSLSADGLVEALVQIDRAIALEGERPTLVATRAYVLWTMVMIGVRDASLLAEVAELTTQALEADPDLPHALLVGGLTEVLSPNMDMARTIRLLKRSTEVGQYADAFAFLAFSVAFIGRPALGVSYARLATQMDALNVMGVFSMSVATLFLGAGADETLGPMETFLERTPQQPQNRLWFSFILCGLGHFERAREMVRSAQASGSYAVLAELIGAALDQDRDTVLTLANGPVLTAAVARDSQYSWQVAQCLTHTGCYEQAVEVLRSAAERGFTAADYVANIDVMLAPLRGRPDFEDVVRIMARKSEEIIAAAGI